MKKTKEQILATQRKRNKMTGIGRFIFFLFILSVCGYLFYTGWIQKDIPVNTRAIIFSKTSGFENTIFTPGKFLWRWENCLPGNMTIMLFPEESKEIILTGKGTLPSGVIYGTWMGNPEIFSFTFAIKSTIQLDNKTLLYTVMKENLTPENMDEYLNQRASVLRNLISEAITHQYTNGDLVTITEKSILDDAAVNFDQLGFEIVHISIESMTVPDPVLYNNCRDGYLSELKMKQEVAATGLSQRTQMEKDYESKIGILEQYGELLTRYPVLIDYFKVTNSQELRAVP